MIRSGSGVCISTAFGSNTNLSFNSSNIVAGKI